MVADPKPQRIQDQAYLDWLKTLPCDRCRRYPGPYLDIVPAHQGFGLGQKSASTKNNDYHALALCVSCHVAEHNQGVDSFWYGFDRKLLIVDHLTQYLQERRHEGSKQDHRPPGKAG